MGQLEELGCPWHFYKLNRVIVSPNSIQGKTLCIITETVSPKDYQSEDFIKVMNKRTI